MIHDRMDESRQVVFGLALAALVCLPPPMYVLGDPRMSRVFGCVQLVCNCKDNVQARATPDDAPP